MRDEKQLLRNAYLNSCRIAYNKGVRSIAFPSISTGAYRFPIEQAAPVAMQTVGEFQQDHPFDQAIFTLFSNADLHIYRTVLDRLRQQPG